LSEAFFWDATPAFITKYIYLKVDSKKQELRQTIELLRWQASLIVNPHYKKNITPQDLGMFEWEEPVIKKLIAPSNFDAINAMMIKYAQQNNIT
jgi:hypothetical protein